MKALLDELRVDEDGTLYIGIVPPEPCGQDGVNLTLALTKGTPCAERITAVLDQIRRMLDDKEAVTGIVHSGEDRFTLIQDPARYSAVDSDTHPNVVDLIGKIADTVWAAKTSQQTLIKPTP